MNIKKLVQMIHDCPTKAVIAITGGGSEAISELLRHGNGSKTLLEAVVPYDQNAFNEFVRGTPDKYCSPGAARDLAMAAYMRAAKLAGTFENVVGVGASCSLVKENEREGRKHQIYVAFQNREQTSNFEYEIDFHRDLPWTREKEEFFAAEKIINALAAACNLNDFITDSLPTVKRNSNIIGHPHQGELIRGERQIFTEIINQPDVASKYIMPGAFNPVHSRHLEMAQKVYELKGERVDFELCVHNVDKPPINFQDMADRKEYFLKAISGFPWAGNLHFTNASTFVKKAQLFPGTTFIVGFDTFRRIANLKYYGGNEEERYKAIDKIRELKCHFLVFHRVIDGKPTNMDALLALPSFLSNLSTTIEVLLPNDISSSDIRKKKLAK